MELGKSKAHKLLGHSNNDSTINTANSLGWKLTRSKKVCESCHLAKAKKNVPNASTHEPAFGTGERVFIDLSKFKKPENEECIGKSNQLMIVDDKIS